MSRRYRRRDDEETSYWLSYSDMMAALLLTFVLIIAFTLLQSKKQYEEKESELEEQQGLLVSLMEQNKEKETELTEQKDILEEQETKLAEQKNVLEEQETKLADQEEALKEQEAQLGEQEKVLETQQEKLDEQEGTLEQQQKLLQELMTQNEDKEKELKDQQVLLDDLVAQNQEKETKLQEQEQLVADQKYTMEQQQDKLDQLVGVRINLIEALKQEFDDSELSVRIDPQTGSIAFDSSIMFDFNDNQLKGSGKDFLIMFLPRYLGILLSDEYKDYVSEIIIEGHTDTVGSYLFNLELSQKRALSVASFCLEENSGLDGDVEELRKIVTANGRSYSNPIYNEDGTVNMDASRRVEFKFRLKEEDMIDEMIQILAEE